MKLLEWLMKWNQKNCTKEGLLITTLDNPGWHVRIKIDKFKIAETKYPNIFVDHGDDWIVCKVEHGIFEGGGDPNKLIEILHIFYQMIEENDKNVMRSDSLTSWLMQWYKSQCDGDWEHMFGMKIQSDEKANWTVKIDLCNTTMQWIEIPPVYINNGLNDWMKVTEGKDENGFFQFVGNGDSTKLIQIIEIFQILAQKA